MNVLRKSQKLPSSIFLKNKLNGCLCYSTTDKNHYDIIIAGGGMVGTTLACTLGKNTKLSNKRILLLEGGQKLQWNFPEKYSNRVSALNPSTEKLLSNIGAWQHISGFRVGQIKSLQVWDGISDANISFEHDNFSDIIAYVVENDLLLTAVGKEVEQLNNVTVVYNSKIKSYGLPTSDNSNAKVELDSGETYSSSLLLGCDGANSQVRKTMGVHYLSWNYDQMGVVATLKLSEISGNFTAWQRFLPTGPVALLPLNDQHSSLVWTNTSKRAKQLLALPEEQFIDALNEAIWKVNKRNDIIDQATATFNTFLSAIKSPSNAIRQLPPSITTSVEGSRAAFPLGFGHAASYIAAGVALVGDAAHRIHPLAGQGVNLGFGDVACLNKILGEAAYSGSPLGGTAYLKHYESERQCHNIPMMLTVDGLQKLYCTDFTPVVLLRTLGLQVAHALHPLKKVIISQAAQ